MAHLVDKITKKDAIYALECLIALLKNKDEELLDLRMETTNEIVELDLPKPLNRYIYDNFGQTGHKFITINMETYNHNRNDKIKILNDIKEEIENEQ
jgi:hypothetical protein